MFLSKLVLNFGNSKARRDVVRAYEMHRTLMNSYPHARAENRCDLLFRLEPARMRPPIVLVQTRNTPDWSGLPAGYLLDPAEYKCLDLAVSAGQRLRFRLRANPAKRVSAKNQRLGAVMAGKRVGLVTEAQQIRWLLRKGENGGFRIPGQWVDADDLETPGTDQLPNFSVDVVPEGRDRNGKPGHGGEFLAVRFDGTLIVTEAQRFEVTVAEGIGPGKAFGFGLLSLARAD